MTFKKFLRLIQIILVFWLQLHPSFQANAQQIQTETVHSEILGDRLILSINNVPYTQLQIEGYINVKECLRPDVQKSEVVGAKNWNIALAAFLLDMTLYQEATKTSGFRPQRDGIQKTLSIVNKSLETSQSFKSRFQILGLNDLAVREHLSRILTIENLRRSRQGVDRNIKSPTVNTWELELQKGAMVRWFDRGKDYMEINPIR